MIINILNLGIVSEILHSTDSLVVYSFFIGMIFPFVLAFLIYILLCILSTICNCVEFREWKRQKDIELKNKNR